MIILPSVESNIDRLSSTRRPLDTDGKSDLSSDKWLELSLASAKMCAYKWDLNTNIVRRSQPSLGFAKLDASKDSWTYLQSIQNIHPEDRSRVMEGIEEAIRSKTQFDVEFRVVLGDEVRWFQSRGQAMYDETGKPCEVLSVASDISDLKANEAKLKLKAEQLAAAKHQLHLALDSSGMVAIAGVKVGTSFQSPKLCRLLGIEDESMWVNPESISEYFHPDDRKDMAENIARDISGVPSDHEFRIRQANGSFRWFSVKGSHLFAEDASSRKAYLVVQDITDRKVAEEALRKKSAEVAAMNERLERFSSIVAHDLKGPLNTISMAADLSERAPSIEKVKETSQFIKRSIVRMAELIDNLLSFAKLENASALSKETVSLQTLLQTVETNLQAAFAQSGATLEIETPLPKILGYPTQLLQLLQNLIGNAIKFRSEEKLKIRISVIDRTEHWEISIADNGKGIDVNDQQKIFAPFERADSSVADGSGLGLSICKRIVDLHHGQIWVQSIKGSGSTFFFTLAKDDFALN